MCNWSALGSLRVLGINESDGNYGRPAAIDNLAFQPRLLQLGFRITL
jgi:hypothetical protein